MLHLLPKVVHGSSASAEGASEENLGSRRRCSVKKFHYCCKATFFVRLRQSHMLANSCFFRAARQKQSLEDSQAPKARAKTIWNLGNIWSNVSKFPLITKISSLRQSQRLASGCAAPTKILHGSFESAEGATEEILDLDLGIRSKSFKFHERRRRGRRKYEI